MGLHPSEIVEGYEAASKKAMEILASLVSSRLENPKDIAQVTQVLRPVLASKMFGNEEHIASLVAHACVEVFCSPQPSLCLFLPPSHFQTCPADPKYFNNDNVRVLKIEGASLSQSHVINGVAFPRDTIGEHHFPLVFSHFSCSSLLVL